MERLKELREEDSKKIKASALHAALTGEIDETNARLFVKQLRAMEGNLK